MSKTEFKWAEPGRDLDTGMPVIKEGEKCTWGGPGSPPCGCPRCAKPAVEHADPREADDWFQTHLGHRFFPNHPSPNDVALEDVVYSLAGMPRYGCHSKRRDGYSYTVLEHSYLIGWYARHMQGRGRDEVRHALAHDFAEFATGDIKRPIKNAMPVIRQKLRNIEVIVAEVFQVPADKPQWLTDLDTRIVADEKSVLLGRPLDGTLWGYEKRGVKGLGVPIRILHPDECTALFMNLWEWSAA